MDRITTAEQADQIEIAWILANVNLEQARSNYEPMPRSNSQVRHKFEMPVPGTWRVNDWNEVEVLIEIPVADFKPSEQEWDLALRYSETRLYIQWQRAGHAPPPLSVVRGDQGNLITQNRRRWLAAREAGVKTLCCWYSPTHPQRCASAKWRVTDEGKDYYDSVS